MPRRLLLGMTVLLAVTACGTAESAPPTLHAGEPAGVLTMLHVTILGRADDPRVPIVRDALGHWNAVAARLGLGVHCDSGTLVSRPVPEDALRATGRAMPWRALGVLRLRTALAGVQGDVVIALSRAEMISFGVTTGGVFVALAMAAHLGLAGAPWLVNVALAKLGLIAAGGLVAGGAASMRLAKRDEQRQLGSRPAS